MNDLNPDARRLVDLAREARTPGEDDKARIAERLALPLAASAAVGTAAGAAKAAGAGAASSTLFGGLSSLGVKIAAVLVVGAVGTALVVGNLDSDEETKTPAPQTHVAEPAPPSEPVQDIAPPQPVTQDEPSQAIPEKKPAPAKHSALPAGGHPAKRADELAEEAALLHRAQSAWRAGNSSEALKLANQHAARFPHSQLANERDVLRVLSLCKMGKVQAAKQVGARLLKKAKGSPWYQSVAGSCAAE